MRSTLLATTAAVMLGAGVALAGEPVKLSPEQMDTITAGGWMVVYNANLADPWVRIVEMPNIPVSKSVLIGVIWDERGALTLVDNPGLHYPKPSLVCEHSGATSVSVEVYNGHGGKSLASVQAAARAAGIDLVSPK